MGHEQQKLKADVTKLRNSHDSHSPGSLPEKRASSLPALIGEGNVYPGRQTCSRVLGFESAQMELSLLRNSEMHFQRLASLSALPQLFQKRCRAWGGERLQ